MNDWMQKLKMRLPAILLLAATLFFWGFYDRYEVVGPTLLEFPTLAEASRQRGDVSEAGGRFVLKVDPADPETASLNFRLPDAMQYKMIRVRGRIKVDGVVVGQYPWRCGRLLLTQYDANDRWIPGKHGLISEDGSGDWMFKEDVFEIIPGAVNADVVIQQAGSEGIAEFDSIYAEPVRLKVSFYVWQVVFALMWLGMGVLFYRRCRLDHRRLRFWILLNVIAILIGTMMPGDMIKDTAEDLKKRLTEAVAERQQAKAAARPPNQTGQQHTDKVASETKRIDQFNGLVGGVHRAGHFGLFASLCFLVYLSAYLEKRQGSYYFKVVFDILLFAAITESLQHLTHDRTPGIGDWSVDLYGLFTGLVLFLAVRYLSGAGKKRAA